MWWVWQQLHFALVENSRLLLLLSAHWHCHGGHRILSLGGAGIVLQRPLGDSNYACTSPQWLCGYHQEECWWHGLIVQINRQPFCQVCCMIFCVLGVWDLSRNSQTRLHLGLQITSINPSLVMLSPFSGWFWTASVEHLEHELTPLSPTPLLFVCQCGYPPCTWFSDFNMIVQTWMWLLPLWCENFLEFLKE